jgi:WD40 repeat protein
MATESQARKGDSKTGDQRADLDFDAPLVRRRIAGENGGLRCEHRSPSFQAPMIHFTCIHCRRPNRVADELAGRAVPCGVCGGVMDVPAADATRTLPPVREAVPLDSTKTPPCPEVSKPPAAPAPGGLPETVGYEGESVNSQEESTVAAEVKPIRVRPTGPLPAVPGYDIVAELGRGGMGVVYRAKQLSLRREVALKMVLAGAHASPEELSRFRQEAEAVAALQHPNIVQIHEIGEHEGRPFFSLEFLGGGNLAQYAARQALPPREAAELVAVLARALHHAHERHIVHRDLKPANILLGETSSTRTAKVTDFGLAKRVNESGQTQSGAVMGTPSYMAPEQAAGKISAIGPLVDVYALGAILYELLTRRPPFRGETLLETLEQVRSREPIPPRQLQPRLHRDLDTICLKALAKDPGKRYATALALAEDLERFANGESILARREGFVEKTWRRVRRHPVAYAVTPLVLLALAIAGYATWATRSESRQVTGITRKIEASIDAPELSGDYLNAVNADLVELRRLAPDHADELRRRLHRRFADHVRDSFSFHRKPVLPPEDAERTRTLIDLLESEHPEDAGLVAGLREDLARRQSGWQPAFVLNASSAGALGEAFDPAQVEARDGVFHVKADRPKLGAPLGTIVLARQPSSGDIDLEAEFAAGWDSAAEIGVLLNARQGHSQPITALAFSRDGRLLVSASGDAGQKGQVRVWDIPGERELSLYHAEVAGLLTVAFTTDGGRLLVGNTGMPNVLILDPRSGKTLSSFAAHTGGVGALAVSADGKTWVTAGAANSKQGEVILWDADSGAERLRLPSGTDTIMRLAYSNDGRHLAAGSEDCRVVLWNLPEKRPRWTSIPVHLDSKPCVRFTADSRAFIYPGWTNDPVPGRLAHPMGLWDLTTGRSKPFDANYHAGGITAMAVSPDSRTFAAASAWGPNRSVRTTTLDGTFARTSFGAPPSGSTSAHSAMEFSPDGKVLAVGSRDHSVRLWNLATRTDRPISVDSNYAFRLIAMGEVTEARGERTGHASIKSVLDAGGKVRMQILRNDAKLREQELSLSELSSNRLRLKASRVGNRLSFQVNQLPPLEFADTFPLAQDEAGAFGVCWPAGVVATRLHAARRDLPAGASPLEQGDRLYAAREYDQARAFFAQQRQAAASPAIAREARLKEGLCQAAAHRLNDAAESFEWVVANSSDPEPWRVIAACHLWMTRLEQNRTADADAVFELISKNYRNKDADLAGHLPLDFAERLIAAYRESIAGTNLIKPRPTLRANLKRAIAVQEFFGASALDRFELQTRFMHSYAQLGEVDEALRTAKELLRADLSALPVEQRAGALAQIAVEASRFLRMTGKPKDALAEVARHLPAPNAPERRGRLYLLVERARVYAALEQWSEAQNDLSAYFAETGNDVGDGLTHSGACLLLGFLRERRGDAAAAVEAWRRGSIRGWNELIAKANPKTAPAEFAGTPARLMVKVLACGALAGNLTDADAKDALDALLRKDSGEANLSMVKDLSAPPTLMRDIWLTPRGRDCARQIAFLTISDVDCLYVVVRLSAFAIMKRGAIPGAISDDQESVLWPMVCGFHERYLEGKLGTAQGVALGLTWKGTTNFLGWGGVKNGFDPAARGPLAYVLGHRYLVLNKPAEAAMFFQQAHEDAAPDSKLRKLAREELDRIKK